MQPQLGRQLAPDSLAQLSKRKGDYDLAVVVADGLSARAPQTHATPLLCELLPPLQKENIRLAPLTIVTQGRVAAGDAVALALGARTALILIGERPGLSAPDSLGAYLTWRPGETTQDADRNCVSNIRPRGLDYADAAFKIVHLLRAMRERGYSGVALKDETDHLLLENRR
jgi:ethanolamine ammonia-lyase small subunit